MVNIIKKQSGGNISNKIKDFIKTTKKTIIGDKKLQFSVTEEDLGIKKERMKITLTNEDFGIKNISKLPDSFKLLGQNNSNDCGPCAIINLLNALGIENKLNIENIRLMTEKNNGEWLEVSEIAGILRFFGEPKQYMFSKNDGVPYQEIIKNNKGIILKVSNTTTISGKQITGQHYVAFIHGNNGELILLDSFNNEPIETSETDFNDLVKNNSEYQISLG